MSSWSELLVKYQQEIKKTPNSKWLDNQLTQRLSNILKFRKTSTVIFYASSFLQQNTGNISIVREDVNGLMTMLYDAPTEKGLTLILHTPGGDPNAVESIVEYLHAKFAYIEVIVPYLAMSGGAMISLASDLLVLGKQSHLGPIDPQLILSNKTHSAQAIQEGFNKAKKDIESDLKLAHFWAPILQNMGPSLFLEAEKALSYSKELVSNWLVKRMLKDDKEKTTTANTIAAYFNAEETKEHGQIHMHGQRIGVEKLKELKIKVELLEDNQDLQNEVLTAYHLMTLIFGVTPSIKIIANNEKMWVKKQQQQQQQQQIFAPTLPPNSP